MSISSLSAQSNFASRLQDSLSPDRLAFLHLVADEATARRLPLYLIGGFVRDLLLGCPATDFDLVVEGDAIALARALAEEHGGKVTVHTRFGTAQWWLAQGFVDLITARQETYPHPGALPKVKPGTLADDLRRRDFTINTLALRLDGDHFGELHDDLGGLADLDKGIVRIMHSGSYTDDPTRILRAVRYEQRYGFRIADEDLPLISAAKSGLSQLSGERLRHELDLILAEEKPAAMLARMTDLDVLPEIHPSLAWDGALRPAFEALNQPEPASWHGVPSLTRVPRRVALGYLLWLSDLNTPAIEALAARLGFTASLRNALLASSALHTDLPTLAAAKPSAITARLDEVPLLAICALSVESVPIRLSASKSVDESVSDSVDEYLSRWRHVKPKTTGHTLIKLGIPPGPVYQTILNCLRTAWLDGEVKTVEDEKELLDKLTKSV